MNFPFGRMLKRSLACGDWSVLAVYCLGASFNVCDLVD